MLHKLPEFAAGRAVRLIVLQLSLASLAWAEDPGKADEPESVDSKAQRDARLGIMRERAQGFEVERISAGKREQVALSKTPVFRYDDQPRGFVDATLWRWGSQGRPVALLKVEDTASGGKPYWQFCVASLADGPINISFPNGGRLSADVPGTTLRPLENPPAPGETAAGRLRQMKELVSRFAGTIHVDGKVSLKQEMRRLTSPIHRYSDEATGLVDGVIFGLTTNGTNPDMLVLIELRDEREKGPRWDYGIVKMTAAEVHIRLDGAEVYSSPITEPMRTWTYFQMPQQKPAGNAAP
jgi:hypothetical protein